jgi:hypothetical protein
LVRGEPLPCRGCHIPETHTVLAWSGVGQEAPLAEFLVLRVRVVVEFPGFGFLQVCKIAIDLSPPANFAPIAAHL